MPKTSDQLELLPLTETRVAVDRDEVASTIRDANAHHFAVYPLGGETSLDFGLRARQPGVGLSLRGLGQVIDYPARDMTVTVNAGITMRALAETLSEEHQWLPVDAPAAERATLGGMIATNHSGPRRYGFGTLRDYVIGIQAIDGRGQPFQGGGRVVKNVAGYDFGKLLIGSLGTVGIVTQVTLKVKPRPESSRLVSCQVETVDKAEQLLSAIANSETTPSAVEWLVGPAWDRESARLDDGSAMGNLVVGLEGTSPEVDWMGAQLEQEWKGLGVEIRQVWEPDQALHLWQQLTDFPAQPGAPLVVKVSVLPSRVTEYVALLRELDEECSIQVHAGNGILRARFSESMPSDVGKLLVAQLHPTAVNMGGSAAVLSSTSTELTRQAMWGSRTAAVTMMEEIRKQFDPAGILNPGRYLY